MLEAVFWIGFFLLFYTYLGYWVVLLIITRVSRGGETENEGSPKLPAVSVLIAAYNEEKVIADKLKNCLTLDYPVEFLQIYVASDGSSDKTNDIVREYAARDERIHLLEFSRTGKSGVLNKAMVQLKDEVVVFSDANTEFMPNALSNLTKHFSDESVGCVCGRLRYRNPGEVVSGKGESSYWRYETVLKKLESMMGYVSGANGAIYAIRRELFESLPNGTINDDFTISMKIVAKGYKCLYEEEAEAFEDVAPTVEGEFKRHIRDGAGHYIAMVHLLKLLNPFLGIRSFIYWSHRIVRWFAPFILVLLFISNFLLADTNFYRATFFLQILFYISATVGMLILFLLKISKIPHFLYIFYIPFYFCNLNLALLLGFLKAVSGKQKGAWNRTER